MTFWTADLILRQSIQDRGPYNDLNESTIYKKKSEIHFFNVKSGVQNCTFPYFDILTYFKKIIELTLIKTQDLSMKKTQLKQHLKI